jgi:hypothetical protein
MGQAKSLFFSPCACQKKTISAAKRDFMKSVSLERAIAIFWGVWKRYSRKLSISARPLRRLKSEFAQRKDNTSYTSWIPCAKLFAQEEWV